MTTRNDVANSQKERKRPSMISVLEQIANGNIDLSQEAIKKDFNEHHHKDVVKVMKALDSSRMMVDVLG